MADIDNSTLLIGKTYTALRDWLAEHMTRYMDVSRDDTGGGGEDIDNSTLLIGKTYTALRDWLAEHMTRYMDVSRDDTGGWG